MTWTYSGDPANSDKDTVRFLVGDNHEDNPLVTDEEIQWALSRNANVYTAAANVAQALSAYFSTLASSTEIGPIKIDYGKRADYYASRAKELQQSAFTTATVAPYAGGISVADKEANESDTDRVQPGISVGIHDFISPVTPNEVE